MLRRIYSSFCCYLLLIPFSYSLNSLDTLPVEHNWQRIRNQVQIMVVPAASTFAEMEALMINDSPTQIAVKMLMNIFGERGYFVKDFNRALEVAKEIEFTAEQILIDKTDILIQSADAEVFVEVKVSMEEFENQKQQLKVELSAVDKYTSEFYAQLGPLISNKRVADVSMLLKEAIYRDSSLYFFLNRFDRSLVNMSQNAEVIITSLNIDSLPLDRKFESGSRLNRLIYDWIKDESGLQFRTISGYTKRLFRFQLATENELAQHFEPFEFGMDLQQYLDKLFEEYQIASSDINLKVVGKRIYIDIR